MVDRNGLRLDRNGLRLTVGAMTGLGGPLETRYTSGYGQECFRGNCDRLIRGVTKGVWTTLALATTACPVSVWRW